MNRKNLHMLAGIASALVLTALVAAPSLRAQAATPTPAPVAASPAGFVASSDALAINCNGSWGSGNLTTEAYDLLDYGTTKSNRVFAQGVELMAPACGLSMYGGGLIWQPDISALLAKTNLPSGNFVLFFDGSAGNGIPTTGSDRVTGIVGGGLKYIMSDNLTWNTVRFEEVFFGANRYAAVSTGISAYFGGTPASPTISTNVRTSLLKKVAKATAKLAGH